MVRRGSSTQEDDRNTKRCFTACFKVAKRCFKPALPVLAIPIKPASKDEWIIGKRLLPVPSPWYSGDPMLPVQQGMFVKLPWVNQKGDQGESQKKMDN